MSIYGDLILPRLCHLAMRNRRFRPFRQRVVGAAAGRVLEIGAGSGLNLPFYGAGVTGVISLEPSPGLIGMAVRAASRLPVAADFVEASAECIPLDTRSVDSVVMTWTGCSIADLPAALQEIRRVLRPGGRLLFVEHGRAPDARVARWQDRITPYWQRIAGGCHLNRKIDDQLNASGFRIDRLETGYIAGPRIMTFMYEGSAEPR